jgi:hypothetical protein
MPAAATKPAQSQKPLQESKAPQPGSEIARQPQQSQQLARRVTDDALIQIDQVADSCRLTLAEQAGSMRHAITVARGMTQLRALIDAAVMAEVMPLMNSELGFLTDRDPSKPVWNKDKNAYEAPRPYDESTVKEAFIVATLRGARPVGNEFNIIASRAYLTKNCFRRLVREFPGLRSLKTWFGVPKVSEGGAICPCRAAWELHGKPDQIEVEIPVRLNKGMGADAAIGKAERKLLARVYSQLTGSLQDEADIDVEGPGGEGSQIIDATATQVHSQAVQDAVDAETAHAAAEGSQDTPERTERDPGADETEADAAEGTELAAHLAECLAHAATQFEIDDVAKSIEESAGRGEIGPNLHARLRAAVAQRREAMSAAAGFASRKEGGAQ